jgi:phosphoglycerate dehydrogenase-like enzyme
MAAITSVAPGAQRPKLAFAYRPALARDVFAAEHLRRLHAMCDVVDPDPLQSFDDDRAKAILSEVTVLVTGWGCPRIDAAVLGRTPHLRMIAHAAGTVKSFIAPEVFEAGIIVTNAAAANAIPVAEFTLAAILFANKDVFGFRELYRRKRDQTHPEHLTDEPVGNWHKTVGIIGLSRIGRRVIELLRPFDLSVLVHDPYLSAAEAATLGVRNLPLDDVIGRADVLSLHAPALEATRHMINARRLALLRDGCTLINTARGSLIDQAALTIELVSGRISAVIDVTEPEVLPPTSPLYDLPNVLLTPHIAGAVGRERERLGEMAVAEVERFLRGVPLDHQVAAATLHLQA